MGFWRAALCDAAGVLLFAAVGRASHGEALDPVGLAGTAGPFLGGWLLGVVLARAWRHPYGLGVGAGIWAGTLIGGMLLRWLTGAGVQTSFVLVAGTVLAVLLLGWRAGLSLARRPVAPPQAS